MLSQASCGIVIVSFSATGCLQLLEILEISLNVYGPPRNFCVNVDDRLHWFPVMMKLGTGSDGRIRIAIGI